MIGCSNFDTISIAVLPCCGAYADFIAGDTTICLNEFINFFNVSISGASPTFSWNFGSGAIPATFSGANPPAVQFVDDGIYDVELILNDSCGIDTATFEVYVNNLPLVEVANDTVLCNSDSLIYNLGGLDVSDYTYNWTPATGLDNPNIANPLALIYNSTDYFLEVTDNFTGCMNSDSVSIILTNITDSVITFSSDTFCFGDSTFLSVPLVFDSVLWSTGSATDSILIHLTMDTSISVIIFTDSCVVYDTVNLVVGTYPTITSSLDDTVCVDETVTVYASSNGTLTWDVGQTADSITAVVNSDTTFIVEATNGSCSISDTINIYVYAMPSGSINSPDSICSGEPVTLFVSGNDNHLWSNGDTSSSSFYTVNTDSLITVTLSNSNCNLIDSHYIYTVDSADISLLGDSAYCVNEVFTLSAVSGGSVTWNNGTVGSVFTDTATADITYYAYVDNGFCPLDTAFLSVTVDSLPTLIVNQSPIEGYIGQEIVMPVTSIAQFWTWQPLDDLSCYNCATPTLTVVDGETFIVTASNGNCTLLDSVVLVLADLDECLAMPSAFTPNADGVNDDLFPILFNFGNPILTDFRMYNRWGEMIWNDANLPWDGTYKSEEVDLGVYTYTIEYKCEEENISKTGNVTLIR